MSKITYFRPAQCGFVVTLSAVSPVSIWQGVVTNSGSPTGMNGSATRRYPRRIPTQQRWQEAARLKAEESGPSRRALCIRNPSVTEYILSWRRRSRVPGPCVPSARHAETLSHTARSVYFPQHRSGNVAAKHCAHALHCAGATNCSASRHRPAENLDRHVGRNP